MKFKAGDWIKPGKTIQDVYLPGPYQILEHDGELYMDLVYKFNNSSYNFPVYKGTGNENTIEFVFWELDLS